MYWTTNDDDDDGNGDLMHVQEPSDSVGTAHIESITEFVVLLVLGLGLSLA